MHMSKTSVPGGCDSVKKKKVHTKSWNGECFIGMLLARRAIL